MSNLNILLEYYQGNKKDKRFKQCEEQLEIIIKELKPMQDLNTRYNISNKRKVITPMSANKKLGELVAEIFKLKGVNIYWHTGMVNAYTFAPLIFHKIANKENLNGANKIVPMTAHIVLFEELVTEANLNAKELLAVILHELGHNMAIVPLRIVSTIVQNTIGIPIIWFYKLMDIVGGKLDDWIREHLPILDNIFMIANDIIKTIKGLSSILGPTELLFGLLEGKIRLRMPTDVLSIMDSLGGYAEEKDADSFATRYGYGPYLITALNKFEYSEKASSTQLVDSVGLSEPYHFINDVNSIIMGTLLSMILEPHPNNNVRYAAVKKKLEADLRNGDYPKEYKQELIEQIAEMDRIYNKLNTYTDNDRITLKKAVYKQLDYLSNKNSDWREMLNPLTSKFNNF